MRRALAASAVSSNSEASATVTRGSAPRAAISAPNVAPAIPPRAQPACSEDMIGRSTSRSTPTPWLFIETSIVALAAPRTNRPAATSAGCGASTARLTASAVAMPPTHVIRAEPCLTTACPAIGSATTTANDMPRMTKPIALLDRSKRSWIHGICATQVPIAAPFTKKTPAVAQRRVTRA